MDRIVCITGPTASGKTRLSIALAKALGGEVVSFDSMQIYRRMDIGTAKPTPEEMDGIPHHMIDVVDPEEDYSVSRYVQEADLCVQDILARGKAVILVGGTGLYIDALIAGREFAPFPSTGRREELTELAKTQGIEAVLARLEQVDPEAAARIDPKNERRVIRALEVYLETGKTITQHNLESQLLPPKYQPVWLGMTYRDRAVLHQRINDRVDAMFSAGMVREVQELLGSGVPSSATSLQAFGYKELVDALQGDLSLDEARESIKTATRRYAKRQLTWFRRNEAIHWLYGEDGWDKVFLSACQRISFFDSNF